MKSNPTTSPDTVQDIFKDEEIKVILAIKLGEPLNDVRAIHQQPQPLAFAYAVK
ncbi:hypothetical protein L915_16976, partial [Phytophthora nicotianae]